tara:strand:+ start:127 stop:504 length:378 start_codon:yes stop_codon:yes gene_type:complete
MDYTIIRDSMIGAILAGIFSYTANMYNENSSYLKASSFFWGIPVMYFYILYIAWDKAGKKAAIDASIHGLLGVTTTAATITLTLFIMNFGKDFIIYVNILILFTIIFLYSFFQLYNYEIPLYFLK